jgi:hypothetical protein
MPVMSKEQERFEDYFFKFTGESSSSIIAYARTITDPWNYLEQAIDELKIEFMDFSSEMTDQLDAFIERANTFLEEVDASLETKRNITEAQDRWASEYDPNAETRFMRYNPREMVRDIWGIGPAMFFVESRASKDAKREWKRVTKDQPASLRMLTEYGNFDIGITERASKAALRVRTAVRKGEPYLSIGAVQVNLNTGKVYCGVYGCNHTGRLSHGDREWMEYQILRILQHLGTHDMKSAGKVFPVFVEEVSPKRDTAKQKLWRHTMYCNNPKCQH